MIRVAISIGVRQSGFLTIENDETGTAVVGHYDVTFDDFSTRKQTKARVESFPRQERIGLELISAACQAIIAAVTAEQETTHAP